MRKVFLLFCLLYLVNLNAQTGIGTTTPNASAKLDVYATNKGFLPPRVTLTSSTDASTIVSPATGLLVYNTGTNAGLRAGYYYWNGTDWTTIATPTSVQTVDYGIARYTGADTGSLSATAIVPFDATAAGSLTWSGNKFTLKANITYELESSLAIYLSSAGTAGRFQIYDYTNAAPLAQGLFMSMNGGGTYNPSANSPMKAIVTPASDIQVGVRLLDYYGGSVGPGIIGSTSFIGTSAAANASYFLVKQVGSSAIVNPWVLSGNNVYNTTGNVGIGNTIPNAKLDIRTSPTSTTDPGGGFIGIGTTVSTASAAGAGAVRYNTSNSMIEYSNGSAWQSLAPGNAPAYAQYRGNAYQTVSASGDKLNFPIAYINVGGFSISNSNTINLPSGRIYRVDLNLGWAYMTGNWCRFAIYNASTGTALSTTAHLENGNTSYNAGGTTTTFVDTRSGSINIDVRYVTPVGYITGLGDVNNGTNFPSITIQAVD